MTSDYSDGVFGDSDWDSGGDVASRFEELNQEQREAEGVLRELGLQDDNWERVPALSYNNEPTHSIQRPRNLERAREMELPDAGFGPNSRHVEPGEPGERDDGPVTSPDASLRSEQPTRSGTRHGDGSSRDVPRPRLNPPAYTRDIESARLDNSGSAGQSLRRGFNAITTPPQFQTTTFQSIIKDVRYVSSGELSITMLVPIDTEQAQLLGGAYGIMLQTTVNRVKMRRDD